MTILIVSDLRLREKATFKVVFLCETWPWSRSINLQELFFMVSGSSYEHLEADAQHCHYASYAVKPWYCEFVNYVFTVCNKVKHSRGLPRLLDSTRTHRDFRGDTPCRARHHTEHSRGDHRVQERALFKKKIGGWKWMRGCQVHSWVTFWGHQSLFLLLKVLGLIMVTMCFYKYYL